MEQKWAAYSFNYPLVFYASRNCHQISLLISSEIFKGINQQLLFPLKIPWFSNDFMKNNSLIPAGIYMFKVENINTRSRCKIYSNNKDTRMTPGIFGSFKYPGNIYLLEFSDRHATIRCGMY